MLPTLSSGEHVFISYSRKDMAYAAGLVNHLASAGARVWIDRNLEPGTAAWVKTLEREIERSFALISVMTPAAGDSAWVDRELDLAQELDKPILPLLVAGRRFMRLRDVQVEDVTGGRMPSQSFVDRLLALQAGVVEPDVQLAPGSPVTTVTGPAWRSPTTERFAGLGAEIELRDDQLVMTRKRVTAAAFGNGGIRTIPVAAIADVRLREAGRLVNGALQLVLGREKPAKAEASEPNTVIFHYRDRHKFARLRAILHEAIAHNRVAGIDPARITYEAGRLSWADRRRQQP